MVERDNQLFQLNGNAGRFQSRIKILGGDIFNGIADVTQGQVPLTDRDTNDQNNQQADHRGNRNQILFQRIEVVEMKINGEPVSMT
jgi:predicted ABC-type transport system involved in lysophospholipase L1 biosynthesis ATPase subunit